MTSARTSATSTASEANDGVPPPTILPAATDGWTPDADDKECPKAWVALSPSGARLEVPFVDDPRELLINAAGMPAGIAGSLICQMDAKLRAGSYRLAAS